MAIVTRGGGNHVFYVIQLLVVGLFIRSNLYFGNSFLTLLTILISIIPLYSLLLRVRIKRLLAFSMSILFINYLVELLFLIVNVSLEGFKDFFYTLSIFPIFLIFFKASQKSPERLFHALGKVLLLFYILSALVVIIELTMDYHLPGSRANLAGTGVYESYLRFIPTGFFFNPNDAAMHTIIFYPFMFYFVKRNYKVYIFYLFNVITGFLLLAFISRSAIAFFIAFPLFIFFIKGRYLKLISFSLIFIFFSFLVFSYAPKRVESTGSIALSYNKIMSLAGLSDELEEGSVGSRLGIYKEIIYNIDEYILGEGFQAKNEILSVNKEGTIHHPHSLFAEFIFNFGIVLSIPVFILFLYPFICSLINFKKTWVYRFIIVQSLYLYLAVHIPATSLRYISVWIILALIYVTLYLAKARNLYSFRALSLKNTINNP